MANVSFHISQNCELWNVMKVEMPKNLCRYFMQNIIYECLSHSDKSKDRLMILELRQTTNTTVVVRQSRQLSKCWWHTFAVVTLQMTSPRCALIILANAPRTPDTLLRRPFSASAANRHTTQRNINDNNSALWCDAKKSRSSWRSCQRNDVLQCFITTHSR